jgi:small GTP-binding protein
MSARSTHRPSFNREAARKVILLGNTGVGKTSLASRWVYSDYDPDVAPTIGASNLFKEISLGDKLINVTLWDTAGQEQFRAITPLYVRGARAAIIVVATDAAESFDAIPTWLDLLAAAQEKPISALLAVNKSDLQDPWADETLSKAIELYRESFLTVFAVSAVSGDQVSELFCEAARIAEESHRAESDVVPSPLSESPDKSQTCC